MLDGKKFTLEKSLKCCFIKILVEFLSQFYLKVCNQQKWANDVIFKNC